MPPSLANFDLAGLGPLAPLAHLGHHMHGKTPGGADRIGPLATSTRGRDDRKIAVLEVQPSLIERALMPRRRQDIASDSIQLGDGKQSWRPRQRSDPWSATPTSPARACQATVFAPRNWRCRAGHRQESPGHARLREAMTCSGPGGYPATSAKPGGLSGVETSEQSVRSGTRDHRGSFSLSGGRTSKPNPCALGEGNCDTVLVILAAISAQPSDWSPYLWK